MTNEQDEKIKVTFGSYANWFMKFYGGWLFLGLCTATMTGFATCKLGADYIVGNWAI